MASKGLVIPPIADVRALSAMAYGNLELSSIMVVHTDGNILYANPAFCKLLNYSAENPLEGRNIETVIVNPRISDTEGEEPVDGGEHEAKYANGKKCSLTLKVSKFVQDYFVVEAKQIIEEILRDSVAGIAHDLRSPVGTLKMILEILRDESLSAEKKAEMIEDGLSSCEVSLTLCDNILLGAQIKEGKIKIEQKDFNPKDLVKILNAVMSVKAIKKNQTLEQSGRPNRGFKFTIPSQEILDKMRSIRGDINKLIFIVLNLLGNAFKYTIDGEVELKIELIHTEEGPDLVISVKDSGNGIDPNNLKKIFEDGVQLENGHSGIGKGLAIVKQLVDAMSLSQSRQASIEAFSDGMGKGSEFIVRIPHNITTPVGSRPVTPSKFAKTPDPVELPVITEKQLDTSITVLVVNDNTLTAKMTHRLLFKMLKYEKKNVFISYSFADAIKDYKKIKPKLIILDMNLDNGHSGIEVADYIRKAEEKAGNNDGRAIIIKYSANSDLIIPNGMDGSLAHPATSEALKKELLRVDEAIGGLTIKVVKKPDASLEEEAGSSQEHSRFRVILDPETLRETIEKARREQALAAASSDM